MEANNVDDFDNNIIELWQGRLCLWDTSSKTYSDRTLKRRNAQEIAVIVGKTVDEVLKKMRSLQTHFARLIKCPPSGSGRKPRTPYQKWLTEKLDFLKSSLKARETISSLQLSISPAEDFDGNDDVNDNSQDDDSQAYNNGDDSSLVVDKETKKPSTNRPIKQDIGPYKRKLNETKQNEVELLESIAKSIMEPITLPNKDDIFGSYVAVKMKKISDPRIKLKLTQTISQAISEAELAGLERTVNPHGPYMTMLNSNEPYRPRIKLKLTQTISQAISESELAGLERTANPHGPYIYDHAEFK